LELLVLVLESSIAVLVLVLLAVDSEIGYDDDEEDSAAVVVVARILLLLDWIVGDDPSCLALLLVVVVAVVAAAVAPHRRRFALHDRILVCSWWCRWNKRAVDCRCAAPCHLLLLLLAADTTPNSTPSGCGWRSKS